MLSSASLPQSDMIVGEHRVLRMPKEYFSEEKKKFNFFFLLKNSSLSEKGRVIWVGRLNLYLKFHLNMNLNPLLSVDLSQR